jgi:hypothetical protein
VPQALIKWLGIPNSLATWEDLQPLQQQFPGAAAWGQAAPYRGGNVTAYTMPVGGIGEADTLVLVHCAVIQASAPGGPTHKLSEQSRSVCVSTVEI